MKYILVVRQNMIQLQVLNMKDDDLRKSAVYTIDLAFVNFSNENKISIEI